MQREGRRLRADSRTRVQMNPGPRSNNGRKTALVNALQRVAEIARLERCVRVMCMPTRVFKATASWVDATTVGMETVSCIAVDRHVRWWFVEAVIKLR